ncbi:toxin HicA [Acaryochloris marina NIES-2412]|uniref:toxin HicA n=1 Tax=Acaryochloris marina TaxID=155978 RepID=UPI00405907D6
MASVDKIVAKMGNNPAGIKFPDLCKVCDHYFGEARQNSGSHRVYKTPWQGDPFVNVQSKKGMGKPYQVKQVLAAIEKLESM